MTSRDVDFKQDGPPAFWELTDESSTTVSGVSRFSAATTTTFTGANKKNPSSDNKDYAASDDLSFDGEDDDDDDDDDDEEEDPRAGGGHPAAPANSRRPSGVEPASSARKEQEQQLDIEFALELARSAELGHPTRRLRLIWAEDGGYEDQLQELLLQYLDKAASPDPLLNVCIEMWDDDDDVNARAARQTKTENLRNNNNQKPPAPATSSPPPSNFGGGLGDDDGGGAFFETPPPSSSGGGTRRPPTPIPQQQQQRQQQPQMGTSSAFSPFDTSQRGSTDASESGYASTASTCDYRSQKLVQFQEQVVKQLKSRNKHESTEAMRHVAEECETPDYDASGEEADLARDCRRVLRDLGGVEFLVTALGDVSRREKGVMARALRAAAADDECAKIMFDESVLSRIWSLVAASKHGDLSALVTAGPNGGGGAGGKPIMSLPPMTASGRKVAHQSGAPRRNSGPQQLADFVRLWEALSSKRAYPRAARTALGQDPNTASEIIEIVAQTKDVVERLLSVEAVSAMLEPDADLATHYGEIGFGRLDRRSFLLEANAPRVLTTLLQKAAKTEGLGQHLPSYRSVSTNTEDLSITDARVVERVSETLLELGWPEDLEGGDDDRSFHSSVTTEGTTKDPEDDFDDDDDMDSASQTSSTVGGLLLHTAEAKAVARLRRRAAFPHESDARDAAAELVRVQFQRLVDASRTLKKKQQQQQLQEKGHQQGGVPQPQSSSKRRPQTFHGDDVVTLIWEARSQPGSSGVTRRAVDFAVTRHGCKALREVYDSSEFSAEKKALFLKHGRKLAAFLKQTIRNDGGNSSSRSGSPPTADVLYARREAACVVAQFAKYHPTLLATDDMVQVLVDSCHAADLKNHNQLLQALLLALRALIEVETAPVVVNTTTTTRYSEGSSDVVPQTRITNAAAQKFLELRGILLLRTFLVGGVTCVAHEAAITMLADFARADDHVKIRLKNDDEFCKAAFDLAQQGGDDLLVHQAAKKLLPVLDMDVPEPIGQLPKKFKPAPHTTPTTKENRPNNFVLEKKKKSSTKSRVSFARLRGLVGSPSPSSSKANDNPAYSPPSSLRGSSAPPRHRRQRRSSL